MVYNIYKIIYSNFTTTMKKRDNTILFLIMIFLNIIIILIQASSSLPHVYYINLDRAFKRNQNMKHYLTEYGFNYTRIEAFDGKDFVHDIGQEHLKYVKKSKIQIIN